MEIMVIDRENMGTARSELKRHLGSCKTDSGQHGEPCFLVSIAVKPKPDKVKTNQTKKVSVQFVVLTKHFTSIAESSHFYIVS